MRCVIYLRVSTDQQAARDDTEEGFSLPARREACLQLVREQGWTVIDEYVDHDSGSKNAANRPRFKAMLDRIFEQGDVDAVVVHKIDRFARDAAYHFAVRAALRRKNVSLVSVTERVEDTASGRLVEGIHALMAEFYSANLATEVKKGMRQKVQIGGWTHRAPLGYINRKESIEGRRIAYVEPDPNRAPLIRLAFEMYATGEHTIEHILDEVTSRGLTMRPWRNRAHPAALLQRPRLGPDQQVLRRHRGVERRRVPRPPPAACGHGDLQSRPGIVRRPHGPRGSRVSPPPLPQGPPGLRGLRPAALASEVQGPVPVLLLPRSEGPAQADRMPGALRRRRRPGATGRGAVRRRS